MFVLWFRVAALRNTWRIACRSNAVEGNRPTKAHVFEQKMMLMRYVVPFFPPSAASQSPSLLALFG